MTRNNVRPLRGGIAAILCLALVAPGCRLIERVEQNPSGTGAVSTPTRSAQAVSTPTRPAATATTRPSATATARPSASATTRPTGSPTSRPSGSPTAQATGTTTAQSGASRTPTPAAGLTRTPTPSTGSSGGSGAVLTTAVRQVVEKVRPAVVQITNEQVQLDQLNRQVSIPAGVGSGVIFDNQGHILTNNHVVEGAQRLTVSLTNGESYQARLIGRDPRTDLAVVQIDGNNLPFVPIGDSSKLEVGDWVVAIGNALALPGGPTVTTGVVSALGRTIQEPADSNGNAGPFLFDLIQTDAAINPGNSGGPLLNLNGEIVGINTAAASGGNSGVNPQNVGFAIAINTAKPIADEIIRTGRVSHPFLGVGYVPLNPALAAQLGTDQRAGAVIVQVTPGSPAAQAGLQPRDIITQINGKPINSESALSQILSQLRPGDTITLTVVRGTQTLQAQATLTEAPQQ